jgi:hypothetical protein
MRKAESTSPWAQKGAAPVASLSLVVLFFRNNDDDIDMASQEEDGIDAQEKASVELQREEFCGLEF